MRKNTRVAKTLNLPDCEVMTVTRNSNDSVTTIGVWTDNLQQTFVPQNTMNHHYEIVVDDRIDDLIKAQAWEKIASMWERKGYNKKRSECEKSALNLLKPYFDAELQKEYKKISKKEYAYSINRLLSNVR